MSEQTTGATLVQRPDLYEDDSERVWAKGHHDDVPMRIAFALIAVTEWHASTEEAFEWAADATVTRMWFRDAPAPHNDELMVRCEPGDDGAEPFTQIDGDWR